LKSRGIQNSRIPLFPPCTSLIKFEPSIIKKRYWLTLTAVQYIRTEQEKILIGREALPKREKKNIIATIERGERCKITLEYRANQDN
jgi:hypothetical protein